MIGRIRVLTRYLFGRVSRSLSGLMFGLSALVLWLIFFSPSGGRVPEPALLILLVGAYGAALAILVTLSIASQANNSASYPMFVRLPSRVEYLASVFLAALLFTTLIQLILTVIVLIQPSGVEISLGQLLEIPPIWLSINILAIVIGLHASDFVMSGWSRVWIFGILAVLLFSQSVDVRSMRWFSTRLTSMANWASRQGQHQIAQNFRNYSQWLLNDGAAFFNDTIGFVFWPIRAVSDAVQANVFNSAQALAPAIILLYATVLFMLAADLFANKDLFLTD